MLGMRPPTHTSAMRHGSTVVDSAEGRQNPGCTTKSAKVLPTAEQSMLSGSHAVHVNGGYWFIKYPARHTHDALDVAPVFTVTKLASSCEHEKHDAADTPPGSSRNVLVGHDVHADAPADAYVPAGHTSHRAPSADWAVPAGHSSHAVRAPLGTVPGPQVAHDSAPGALATVPSVHGVHEPESTARNHPASHGSHAVRPALGTLPAGHASQLGDPGAGATVPSGHD